MSHRKYQGKALTPDAKLNWKSEVELPRMPDTTTEKLAGAAERPKATVKRRRPRIPADRKMAVKGASERVAARTRRELAR
jgi:hypothetical protein